MTATLEDEQTSAVEAEENEDSDESTKRDRDFTKFRDLHKELADYVNANSGLDAVTPNQVKAILLLRTDFNNSPEQAEKKAERKAKREAEKQKYAGLTPDQIKQEKAAARADKQAATLQKRVEEAMAKAQRIREGKEASGEDLAATVNAEQGETETPKRRIGRNK